MITKNVSTILRNISLVAALGAVSLLTINSASAADQLLAGTVLSSTGEKLGGATVSAKAEGSAITTSVFTDDQGNYYFPPMAAGT